MNTTYKQNLHTHSTYSDGKSTPRELVLAAIERGFTTLGFSEHSYMSFSDYPYQMTVADAERYKKEIRALKEEYRERLDIFCGLELDIFSDMPTDGYDYIIGSVHYLDFDGRILDFDKRLEGAIAYVNDHFGGDGLAFAKKYYETVARLGERDNVDIIGHFDLITKNNDKGGFFDTTSSEYLSYGMEAIGALRGKIPFFEVNTGAIARGYRTTPYPELVFLREFRKQGFGAVISADCHNKDFLDCHFDEARELLLAAGFKSKWILTDGGFTEVAL